MIPLITLVSMLLLFQDWAFVAMVNFRIVRDGIQAFFPSDTQSGMCRDGGCGAGFVCAPKACLCVMQDRADITAEGVLDHDHVLDMTAKRGLYEMFKATYQLFLLIRRWVIYHQMSMETLSGKKQKTRTKLSWYL